MSNIYQRHYDSTKASRDSCREQGMPFEAALFTRAMQYAASEFERDVVVSEGDLELTPKEEELIAPYDVLREEHPEEPPEDFTATNMVWRCLEDMYQTYCSNRLDDERIGMALSALMDAYDEMLD